ncbi:atrial natriuretic peptide receptor 2-like [Mytilus californianus]|uniref:atrial natriuretic peptide receptor 2-like n=1 Tax=Mytilus californianus TaxID=6549 RepID=UPI00224698A0|nr:atrial natriuretic peptide receptor 2-like [Mytilus californianus]
MDYFAQINSDLTFSLHNAGSETSYPIAGFTHFIAYKTSMSSCVSAREFIRYIDWFMTDSEQRKVCISYGMAPLSTSMVARITEKVLKEFTCQSQSVWDMMKANIAAENKQPVTWIVPVAVSVPLFIFVVLSFSSYICFQRIKFYRKINNDDWFIPIEDVIFFYDQKVLNSLQSKFISGKSIFSLNSSTQASECPDLIQQVLQWPGKWNSETVGLRLLQVQQLKKITRPMKARMLVMKDRFFHNNIVRFFGLTELDSDHYIISEYCGKGQLIDLLQNEKFNMSKQLKLSISVDIASGMHYLHSKNIIHGNFRSTKCLIDSKWTVKICDWEYNSLIICQDEKRNSLHALRKNNRVEETTFAIKYQEFWVAPEIIRLEYKCNPTTASDVYSFAIILQEIYTREDPYSELADLMSPEDVVNAVVQIGGIRPKPIDDMPISVRQCMEIAWGHSPEDRPSFEQILKMLKRSSPTTKSVLDSMMETIEEYTVLLEEKIDEKTVEHNMTIQHLQHILTTYLPKPIIHSLTNGKTLGVRRIGPVGLIYIDVRNFHYLIAGMKKINNKIKSIENFHSRFKVLAEEFSAFIYSISFDSVVFILGMDCAENGANSIPCETANMCLQLNKIIQNDIRPKDLKYSICATLEVLHEKVLDKSGRYQIFGSALEKVTTISKAAKHLSVLISLPLCAKIKAYDCFLVTEVIDSQLNGQNVFRLERRNETIMEEDIDVLTLDEDDEHAGSVDSGLDVRITKLEESVDKKM